MELKTIIATDASGNIVNTAQVYIYERGTETAVSGFKTKEGDNLTIPFNVDTNGIAAFMGENGVYDLQFEYNGAKGPILALSLYDPVEGQASIVEAVKTQFASPQGRSFIGQFDSFASLRVTPPTFEGEVVYLGSWNVGGKTGGGEFVGRLNAQADDGGWVASSGEAWHWVRKGKALNELNIYDFGATGDGVTDDGPAVEYMFRFMISDYAMALSGDLSNTIGVRFPAGKFYVSPREWSKVGNPYATPPAAMAEAPDDWIVGNGYLSIPYVVISGPDVEYGLQVQTTLISDLSENYVFHVNARRLILSGITFRGGQTNTNQNLTTNELTGSPSNLQPFLKNECIGGQYITVSCVRLIDIGGRGLEFIDTLDCRINEFYPARCADWALVIGWSWAASGNWDHSTAVSIRKSNAQYCYVGAFLMPRTTQCIMEDTWIEHSARSFDISHGQWTMIAPSIESTKQDACCFYAKVNMMQFSHPNLNNGAMDFDSTPSDTTFTGWSQTPMGTPLQTPSWSNAYEKGLIWLDAAYSEFRQAVSIQQQQSLIRGGNASGAQMWVNLCRLETHTVGGGFEIEVYSKKGVIAANSGTLTTLANQAFGKTVIRVQNSGRTSDPVVTFHHEGTPGVVRCSYNPSGVTYCSVYILLEADCAEYAAFIKGTGATRRATGAWDMVKINNIQYPNTSPGTLKPATATGSMHNGICGIAATGDTLSVTTTTGTPTSTTTPAGYVKININGTPVLLPYYNV